jgi:hypothetical protein
MAKKKRDSSSLAKTKTADSWERLVELENEFGTKGRWAFRGHRDEGWELESTLERAIRRFNVSDRSQIQIEAGLIRQFSRRAHHHMPDPPAQREWVEWLALMQHHGAPTRLLDFTYSFYVALFFALEEMDREGKSALWAIDIDWTDERLQGILENDVYETFTNTDRNARNETVFGSLLGNQKRMAFFINPYRLNQRLSIQQGVFLCPGDISHTIVENLDALGDAGWGIQKIKIELSRSEYQKCIRKLIRMNMTRATLFPGLDGFAMSQKMAIANPHILVGDSLYPTGVIETAPARNLYRE